MAGNLARRSMWEEGEVDAEEAAGNGTYWTAVKRLFEQRIKQSDRYY
jgi:hypothetical protein